MPTTRRRIPLVLVAAVLSFAVLASSEAAPASPGGTDAEPIERRAADPAAAVIADAASSPTWIIGDGRRGGTRVLGSLLLVALVAAVWRLRNRLAVVVEDHPATAVVATGPASGPRAPPGGARPPSDA